MTNKEIVEWDINTWQRVFDYWEKCGDDLRVKNKKGLELGARNGGTTLFFIKKFDVTICCSDFGFPTEQAKKLHEKHNVQSKLEYCDVDATNIPFDDNSFDFVIFKSMLGTIGSYENFGQIEKAMSEIHRVLKPKGILFFAENLQASPIHDFARKKFVSWGSRWYYVNYQEMNKILIPFYSYELKTTGFLSAFIPNSFPIVKPIFAKLDSFLEWLPENWKYVSYGHAIK